MGAIIKYALSGETNDWAVTRRFGSGAVTNKTQLTTFHAGSEMDGRICASLRNHPFHHVGGF